MKSKKSVFIEGHIMSNSCHGQPGQPFCIHRVRLFGWHPGYVSNQAKLFNETIVSGFINLPKFGFFLLSTLMMMNQEDNSLSINDKTMDL